MRDLALRSALTVLACCALVACRDEGSGVVTARLSEITVRLTVGEERLISASCETGSGRTLPAHPLDLRSLDPHVADAVRIGAAVRVRAIAPGDARILANCDPRRPFDETVGWDGQPWRLALVTVTSPTITTWSLDRDADTLELARAPGAGESRLLTATALDEAGRAVPATGLQFESEDQAIVLVDTLGRATAVGAGVTRVIIRGFGREESLAVRVTAVADLAARRDVNLFAALWTQGTQNEAGTIPMIRDSRAAVVSVLAHADGTLAPQRVRLRLFNADSVVIHTDSAPLRLTAGSLPDHVAPSAQLLVPAGMVNDVRWWEVVRDATSGGVDASSGNDRFPRRAAGVLSVVSVPTIRVHLVPITLSQHAGVTPVVTDAVAEDFVWYLRLRYPFARIEVTVGAPLVSGANFVDEGDGESGGSAFFSRVLRDVDLARSTDPNAVDSYWIGVLPKPNALTTTLLSGLAYLPTHGAASSLFARSEVVLGREWYPTDPRVPGGVVGHELGHNLGRRHAPCGNVGTSDFSYRPSNGFVGRWVHVLIDWTSGTADSAAVLDGDRYGDIMSYCGPKTVGPYTYSGILGFRQLFGAALVAEAMPTRVLAIRGSFGARGARLEPAQTLRALPTGSSLDDRVRVELLAADGRVLRSVAAIVGEYGEGGMDRPFGIQIPLTDDLALQLREIRAYTPGGVARLVAEPGASPGASAAAAGAPAVSGEPAANGGTLLRCANPLARSIVVQDEASGQLLGSSRGTELVIRAPRGTRLVVSCGDGVRNVDGVVLAR